MIFSRRVALLWTVWSALSSSGGAADFVTPKTLLSSKIVTNGDFVTLPVKVNGEWLTFIVDTGSPTTAVDTRLRERLTLAGDAERANAYPYKESPELYLPPQMTVAGTESGSIQFPPKCAIVCIDLSRFQKASDLPVRGVLGMDFLESYALQLDLSAGNLKLLDPATLKNAQRHDAEIKIDIPHRQPSLQVESHDLVHWALIDTGALLSFDIQREAHAYLLEQRELREFIFEVEVDGEKKFKVTDEGWLHELKVGPFSHRRLAVNSHQVSLLGLYYWRRYRCIFDFPGKMVYLDKGPFFDLRDDSDHAGIYVESIAGPTPEKRVTYVVKGSEGESHGVHVGDRLLSIDGKDVESESVHGIYRRLSFHHERDCALALARNGGVVRVTIPATGLQPRH